MTTEPRGIAGPYTAYDGLSALHATDTVLPLREGSIYDAGRVGYLRRSWEFAP